MMERWRATCIAALVAAALLFVPRPAWCEERRAPPAPAPRPGRALLLRGPEPRKGLPYFSPNAIASLVGVYAHVEGEIIVRYTRAPLVWGSAWENALVKTPENFRAYLRKDSLGRVFALASPRYTLFFELHADSSATRAFALAFERRFRFFFEGAVSDAELSFPAYVDYGD